MTRIAVEITGEFSFHQESLQNPDRIFFDLPDVGPRRVERGVRVITVGDKLLKQIRVAANEPDKTRVVLDLETGVECAASILQGPYRLMIELRSKADSGDPGLLTEASKPGVAGGGNLTEAKLESERGDERPTAPVIAAKLADAPSLSDLAALELARLKAGNQTELKTTPPAKREAPPPKKADAPAAPPAVEKAVVKVPPSPPVGSGLSKDPAALAARRNSNGNTLIRALGLKLGRVVIDPGHGGHDEGTRGRNGLLEKELVLDVSQRLAKLVEQRMGAEVVLTRNDDTFIPLEMRTQIANDRKADLFLSIHANSSPLRGVSGVETYYLNFSSSREALDVAARENAGSNKSIHELSDLIRKITLNDKILESKEFANRVQKSLFQSASKANSRVRNRGVKKAPFVVLIGAEMPSVLAEIGFVSNSREESLLKQSDQRDRIAEALYDGLADYAETLSRFEVAQQE